MCLNDYILYNIMFVKYFNTNRTPVWLPFRHTYYDYRAMIMDYAKPS